MSATRKGIVLRQTDFGEQHAYLTVLSDLGRIEVLAQGIRRRGSRLFAAVRPFTYSELTLHETKSGYRLGDARVIKSYFDVSRQMESYALACYLAQACDVLGEGESGPELLELLLYALHAITGQKRELALIKAAFEMRLSALLGFAPALDKCAFCGREEGIAQPVLSPERGVMYCAACAREVRAGRCLPLSPGVWHALCHVLGAEMPRVFSFALGEENLAALAALSEEYLRRQTGQTLPALAFYQTLTGGEA